MGLLGDGGGSDLAGTDGPDGLVGDHDGAPVLNGLLDGIELSLQNIVRLTSFTLLNSLTNAKDGLEAGSLRLGDLLGDDIIGLAEELSALGVANEGPLEAEVNDLLGTDLTGEGTVTLGADVLRADEDVGVEHGLG